MEGGVRRHPRGETNRSPLCRSAGGRQAAEHAGQRTRGRPLGRRLVRHSAAQRLSSLWVNAGILSDDSNPAACVKVRACCDPGPNPGTGLACQVLSAHGSVAVLGLLSKRYLARGDYGPYPKIACHDGRSLGCGLARPIGEVPLGLIRK